MVLCHVMRALARDFSWRPHLPELLLGLDEVLQGLGPSSRPMHVLLPARMPSKSTSSTCHLPSVHALLT